MRNRNSNLNHIVLLSADAFNPLPHMPILGSSSSTANKDMMSKYGKMGIQLSDLVENIVGEKKLLIMSNFFFSHSVFKSCLLLMHQNEYL